MPANEQRPPAPLPMTALARGRLVRVLYLVHRMLRAVFGNGALLQVYALCAQPIGAAMVPRMRSNPNLELHEVKDTQDPLAAQFPRPAAVLQRRFESGAACWALRMAGDFGGYLWLARTQYEEDEVRCRYVLPPGPGAVWDFDVYIAPAHRSARALARLWHLADERLQAQGVRWSFSRISLFNAASVQAHERLGARRVGTAVFLVLGRLQLSVLSQAPFVHLGWSPAHVPTFRLHEPAALH